MDRDDYYNMDGYNRVSYSSGWNPSVHDRMLEEKIDNVFHKYKTNKSGELKPKHFHKAYSDLCLQMGLAPPRSMYETMPALEQCDHDHNGNVNPH